MYHFWRSGIPTGKEVLSMEYLSQVWKIARRRLLTPKLLLYTAVLFSASFKFNAPLRALILELNYPVTWCLFPFMCSMPYYLALISFGVLYIHSDVPFMQMENMYATIRVGRGRWLWGQIIGIFLRSVLAVAVAVLCSYANLIPYIELSGQWGRMASTIANTSVGYEANLYYYFWDQAMLVVSPFRLMFLNITVVVLLAFFLGLLLFFISLHFGKPAGALAGVLMYFGLITFLNTFPYLEQTVSWFVPMSWAMLVKAFAPRMGYWILPPLSYIFSFLIVGSVSLCIILSIRVNRIEFDWEREDA